MPVDRGEVDAPPAHDAVVRLLDADGEPALRIGETPGVALLEPRDPDLAVRFAKTKFGWLVCGFVVSTRGSRPTANRSRGSVDLLPLVGTDGAGALAAADGVTGLRQRNGHAGRARRERSHCIVPGPARG